MNCAKLNQDIKRLKVLQEELQKQVDYATETGQDRIKIMAKLNETSEAIDSILEYYLDDFYEKNPKLLQVQLGDRIEGFENCFGNETDIESISAFSDGSALIGGHGGALYHARMDRNGVFQLGERIEAFRDRDGNETAVYSISTLSDGSALIGGYGGALYHARIDENGDFQLGERIEGFRNRDGGEATVCSISTLSDGSALIGGGYGALYRAKMPSRSVQNLRQNLDLLIF